MADVAWVIFRRYGGQTSKTLHAIPTDASTRPKALCGAGNSMHTSIVHTAIDLPKCVRCEAKAA